MVTTQVKLESIKNGGNTYINNGDDEPMRKVHVPAKYMGTAADQADMGALGREQVLRVRSFMLFLSILMILTLQA